MWIGELRHRVTLQSPSAELSGLGHPSGWTNVITVWAAIEPLRGREFWAAQQVQAEQTVRIRIRYRSGITPIMRAVFGTRIYDIMAVIDPEERHRELQLMCRVSEPIPVPIEEPPD